MKLAGYASTNSILDEALMYSVRENSVFVYNEGIYGFPIYGEMLLAYRFLGKRRYTAKKRSLFLFISSCASKIGTAFIRLRRFATKRSGSLYKNRLSSLSNNVTPSRKESTISVGNHLGVLESIG